MTSAFKNHNQIIPRSAPETISAAWNGGSAKGGPTWFYAKCPVHDDKSASLSMTWCEGKSGNGKVVFKCHRSCEWKEIEQKAIDDGLIPAWTPAPKRTKGATLEFWEDKGLIPMEAYIYDDENEVVEFEKWRFWDPSIKNKTFRQRKSDGNGGFDKWNLNGSKKVLYKLKRLLAGIKAGETIFIMEGEKDVNLATADGLFATTNFEGAGKWLDEYTEWLKGAKRIIIVADNDYAGYEHVNFVAKKLTAAQLPVEWVSMPGAAEHGDYSDWREDFDFSYFDCVVEDAQVWTEKVWNPFPSPEELRKLQKQSEVVEPFGSEAPAKDNVVAMPNRGSEIDIDWVEAWTDAGNAKRFERAVGDDVKYSAQRGWYYWTGKKYQLDEINRVKEMAKDVARTITQETHLAGAERLIKFASKSLDEAGTNNMLKSSRSRKSIAVHIHEFNNDPNLLTTQDGVIDLLTGKRHDHAHKFKSTQETACGYSEEAFNAFTEADLTGDTTAYYELMPNFMNMMSWICADDMDKLHYLQEVMGYAYTGNTFIQQAWFCEGFGRNLKSTWIDNSAEMLGEYATTVRPDMFMRRKNGSESQMDNFSQLIDIRLAAVQEINSDDSLDEGKFKTVTGNTDKITARFLRFEPFKFRNRAKFIFRANHLPRIRNQDDGVWRRLRRLPFHNQIPEDEVIGNFDELLKTEWAAQCAFYVRGFVRLKQRGFLIDPACVRAGTEEYKQMMDLTGQMVEECLIPKEGAEITVADMQTVNAYFCEMYNQAACSGIELGRRLAQKGIKSVPNGKIRVYSGYEVAPEFKPVLEAHRTKKGSRYQPNY